MIECISSKFRAQPIVHNTSMEVKGVEILCRDMSGLEEKDVMLAIDCSAIQAAANLSPYLRTGTEVHCNVEISSLLSKKWLNVASSNFSKYTVIEIVERNEDLLSNKVWNEFKEVVSQLKLLGYTFAVDDCTGNTIEERIFEFVEPKYIKIIDQDLISWAKSFGTSKIIVEHIETREQANNAMLSGAFGLQGYWCDLAFHTSIPRQLTPPGYCSITQ